MPNYDSPNAANQYSQNLNEKGSRIDSDAAQLRALVDRLYSVRNRVMRHAQSLGYWQPTPETTASAKIAPVSSTLQDSIRDLEKAVEELSGALNVFD